MSGAPLSTLERARSGSRAAALAAITGSMLGASHIHRRAVGGDAGDTAFARWRTAWAASLLRTFGVSLRVSGPIPAPATGPRLVIANHRSPVDILIALRLVGGTVVSRGDLADWPVLGPAARAADTIFVTRDDPRSGLEAIRQMRARLRANKSVILFPEGGTFLGDTVRPFQAGALAAARGLAAEVVTMGLAYEPGCEFVGESFVDYTVRMAGRPKIAVAVRLGAPRPLSDHRQREVSALRSEVQALVQQARAQLTAR